MRWQYEATDLAPGSAILAAFKPFLIELLHSNLAKKTFNRHRDSLWQVGGELIRLRQERPDLRRIRIDRLIRVFVNEDEGPLIWPRISRSEQDTIDAVCRKLYRFLNHSTSAE